jgi:DNA-binding response OmpR family regulator
MTTHKSILKIFAENKAKVASKESIIFNIKGVLSETDQAVQFLISHPKKGLIESWIPKTVIVREDKDSVSVKGWFVAKEMMKFVNMSLLK